MPARSRKCLRAAPMVSRFDGALAAYRIVRAEWPPFDGAGAFRWGGRWTSPGRYVVHAAESYSLAVLENLVHFNLGELPPRLVVVRLEIPAGVSRETVHTADKPGWDAPSPYSVSRKVGHAWYDQQRSAVLIVPSILSPYESNILIHQGHPDSRQIEVGPSTPAALDERLRTLFRARPAGRS